MGVEINLYSFLTLALDEGGWSTPLPGRFTSRKEFQYPSYKRLDGTQGRSGWLWRRENLQPSPGFQRRFAHIFMITILPSACLVTSF